jgi:hypothetical protein
LKTIFRTGRVVSSRKFDMYLPLMLVYTIVWDDTPTDVFEIGEALSDRDLLFFPEHATLNQMKCIFNLQKNDK